MTDPKDRSEPSDPKKVDESWKESVQKERDLSGPPPAEEPAFPTESDFSFFISTLGIQAMVALGELPGPSGVAAQTDPRQAQYLIDTIQMLSEKTRGNLSPEESQLIQDLLYDLRMKFVRHTQPS